MSLTPELWAWQHQRVERACQAADMALPSMLAAAQGAFPGDRQAQGPDTGVR